MKAEGWERYIYFAAIFIWITLSVSMLANEIDKAKEEIIKELKQE